MGDLQNFLSQQIGQDVKLPSKNQSNSARGVSDIDEKTISKLKYLTDSEYDWLDGIYCQESRVSELLDGC